MKNLIFVFALVVLCTLNLFSQNKNNYISVYVPPGTTVSPEISFIEDGFRPIVIDFPASFDSCDVTFSIYTNRPTKSFNLVRFMSDTLTVSGVKANQTVLLEPALFAGFSNSWKLNFSVVQATGGYIIIGARKY